MNAEVRSCRAAVLALDMSPWLGQPCPVLSRLEVDAPVTVSGTYFANWEVATLRLWMMRPFPHDVRCLLESDDGRPADVFTAAGVPVPPPNEWRHHRGLRFEVVADVTPLAKGRFGHMGIARWRLRVNDWRAVSLRA